MSASKIRPIARCFCSYSCEKALVILGTIPNKGAYLLKKVLMSAVANAVNRGNNVEVKDLVIDSLIINEGPQSKRIWARSRGKADRLIKRTAHIVVVVREKGG